MKRKPLAELIPQLAKGIAPTAAVATSLISPLVQAASGDLDPAFADVGRLGPISGLEGAAWSVEALAEGGALFGGGDLDFRGGWYCYYSWYDCEFEASNFANRLNADGSFDPAFAAAGAAQVEVFDIARQADGKVVAAGHKVTGDYRHHSDKLLVFRLADDGTLDTSFGIDGLFELSSDDYGPVHQAHALAIELNGRIVVAGVREIVVGDTLVSELIVLRLRADGRLDESFGDAGAWVGPAIPFGNSVRLARTAAGAYRVAIATDAGCAVVGVTRSGALDDAFGSSGIATVESTSGEPVSCQSIVAEQDGGLLVAGSAGGHGFAARLLAGGAPDPAFAPDAGVADSMDDATSIASAADGRVLIAGSGVKGATIMRLQATGQLDSQFGNGGRTWIDLPSESGAVPIVHDMALHADGSVIAAGGDLNSDRPFVVRLLGDEGGDSPGVLSIEQPDFTTAEQDEILVTVRRTGGSSGPVSIAYRTATGDGTATGGQDYEDLEGRLDWADGDTGERQIALSILADAGDPEEYENFRVAIADAQGGAGIGTHNASVYILPDGAPAGQFALDGYDTVTSEAGVVQFWVYRNYYYEGAVSVTVTMVADTAAAGADFIADPVTVSWSDQDVEAKLVEIPIVDDTTAEGDESFRVQLSDPTGGAIVGPRATQTITIAANDQPARQLKSTGGGGAAGFLSLLLIGLAELVRSARRSLHRGA